ncbi:MAG TPA: protein phosphatase 2C domain-containing protein [Micromonosporaceae bacterium]|nr:protein phosphatase 2C domain-containing protein [Micromonosporaceae bacterium]
MITVQSGYASEVGRARPVNQDSLLVSGVVFAVADGMGGHAAGEVASQLAVAGLRRLADRPVFNADDVRAELVSANGEIVASAARFPERQGMGTTVAGLGLVCIAGADHWVVFNVGDSRVYRFADDELAQVTVDHTEVAELVASGAVTAEDADYHPRRHVVTRALGSDPAPEPDVWVFPPTAGERFLICSDGLFLELSEAEIVDLLRSEPSPQAVADELVRRAKAYGGRDDATVIVVDYVPPVEDAMEDTAPRPRRAGSAG